MAGSTQRDGDPITEINITPLVDVCLVLVIIFMAVAPMAMTVGMKVLESKAKASEGKVSADDNVQVKLTEAGALSVNGALVELASLRDSLLLALSKSKDKMVIITADEKNKVGQVVTILDTAQQAGAQKLAILKSEPAQGAGK
jgi:biopolymer transport protein ExbD